MITRLIKFLTRSDKNEREVQEIKAGIMKEAQKTTKAVDAMNAKLRTKSQTYYIAKGLGVIK